MKIYQLNLDVNNYLGCFVEETTLTKKDFREINRARELSFNDGCITLKYADDDELKLGDVLRCWDFIGFIINDRAYKLFSNNPKLKAQYIKFQDDFILLNNLLVIDALDNEKTEFEYFEDDIIGVEKYAFNQLDYPPLFQTSRLDGLVDMDYFVTDEFINFVNDNNIKGFLFKEVWDSEVQ